MAFDVSPSRDCADCPRLAQFRAMNRAAFPDWSNAPVNSFGEADARLLIVGLAPGLRGANRTGRPFTGDYAGDLLYETLLRFGFASGSYDGRPDDGLGLVDCAIVNSVRCVPPQNKPNSARNRNLPPIPHAIDRRARPLANRAGARTDRARERIARLRRASGPIPLRSCRPPRARSRQASSLRQLSLLALQHQHRRIDGRGVSRCLRIDPR